MNKEELASAILSSKDRIDKLLAMSDAELADELLHKVWAEMNVFTEQSDLLEIAMERLKERDWIKGMNKYMVPLGIFMAVVMLAVIFLALIGLFAIFTGG